MYKLVIISASTLKLFKDCPRKFQYNNLGVKFSDKPKISHLVEKDRDLCTLLFRNHSMNKTISLVNDPKFELSVSASSLSQFKKCRRAFSYRIAKTPQTDRVALTNFQFGSLVHNSMDDFVASLVKSNGSLRNVDFKKEFVRFYYSDALKQKIESKLKDSDEWLESKDKVFKNFYISLQNHFKFLNSILEQGSEPILNFWFGTPHNPLMITSLDLPNLRFIGEIDHYYENCRGNLTIEDTKTSSSDYYLDRNQLYLYAFALEQVYANKGIPKKVDELNYNLVKVGKKVPVPFGRIQREALLVDLVTLNTCVSINSFPATKGKHCETCPWRTRCSKEISLSETNKSILEQALKANIKKQ